MVEKVVASNEEYTKQNKVLICEDNKTTAFCIKKMLERLGYQADIAYSATEAEIFLSTKKYELMTLDIILPDKNGLDLLDEIKNNESTKNLPVIIISASEQDIAESDIQHKIVGWLQKSFEIEELKNSIKKITEKKTSKKIKMLHIEDNEDILEIISLTLQNIADVTKINNLCDAEKIINESVFDMIIFDYKFPEGTCEGLIDTIKESWNKKAYLIVFSAYEINPSLLNKVDNIILKTKVSNEEFLECIKTCSEHKR